jgi:hypothetical protein
MDSLDVADLIMCLDDEFDNLGLNEIDVATVGDLIPETVGQLHAHITSALSKNGPVNSEEVWVRVCRVVGTTFNLNPATIHPEHRFDDFGMH